MDSHEPPYRFGTYQSTPLSPFESCEAVIDVLPAITGASAEAAVLVHALYESPHQAVFMAGVDGQASGMVGVRHHQQWWNVAGVFGLWVEPASEQDATAAGLLDAVTGWACRQDIVRIEAWLENGDHRQRRWYERAGYRRTGHHAASVCRDGVRMIEMALAF